MAAQVKKILETSNQGNTHDGSTGVAKKYRYLLSHPRCLLHYCVTALASKEAPTFGAWTLPV